MPPNESAFVVQRKVNRALEALADGKNLEANSPHAIDDIRRATRDALAELAEEYDEEHEVDAVALPSERLDEPESEDVGDDGDDSEDAGDEG